MPILRFIGRLLLSAGLLVTFSFPSLAEDKAVAPLNPIERNEALNRFVAAKKFVREGTYPGSDNETNRTKLEAWVNELAERLRMLPLSALSKSKVLAEFKPTLEHFEDEDSEDRDRLLGYLEDLMDVFGIESSDGMLNKWRYGFDPKESPDARNEKALAAMTPEERKLLEKLDGITASTAASVLASILGPASSTSAGIQIWFIQKDGLSAISLASNGSAAVLSWMVKDRFLYNRKI